MSQSVQVVRSAILFGVVALALAGCGAGDSGPSSHTVKRLAANASYTDVLKLGNFRLQMEAIGGTSSPGYLKTKAERSREQRTSFFFNLPRKDLSNCNNKQQKETTKWMLRR